MILYDEIHVLSAPPPSRIPRLADGIDLVRTGISDLKIADTIILKNSKRTSDKNLHPHGTHLIIKSSFIISYRCS